MASPVFDHGVISTANTASLKNRSHGKFVSKWTQFSELTLKHHDIACLAQWHVCVMLDALQTLAHIFGMHRCHHPRHHINVSPNILSVAHFRLPSFQSEEVEFHVFLLFSFFKHGNFHH